MKLRPRLIPSVILAATVLLGLKVSDIFSVGGHALAEAASTKQATGAPLDLTSLANAACCCGACGVAGFAAGSSGLPAVGAMLGIFAAFARLVRSSGAPVACLVDGASASA